MRKYSYNIGNLDCANCARKIEENLNNNSKLNNVVVSFSTSRITFSADADDISLEEINNLKK